jgi:hypothetical protein
MSFDVIVGALTVLSSAVVFTWFHIRTTQQLQFERQQVQFWGKVLSKNATTY